MDNSNMTLCVLFDLLLLSDVILQICDFMQTLHNEKSCQLRVPLKIFCHYSIICVREGLRKGTRFIKCRSAVSVLLQDLGV